MAEMREGSRAEDLDAWRAKYPEAVAGYGRTMLYRGSAIICTKSNA